MIINLLYINLKGDAFFQAPFLRRGRVWGKFVEKKAKNAEDKRGWINLYCM